MKSQRLGVCGAACSHVLSFVVASNIQSVSQCFFVPLPLERLAHICHRVCVRSCATASSRRYPNGIQLQFARSRSHSIVKASNSGGGAHTVCLPPPFPACEYIAPFTLKHFPLSYQKNIYYTYVYPLSARTHTPSRQHTHASAFVCDCSRTHTTHDVAHRRECKVLISALAALCDAAAVNVGTCGVS